MFNLKTVTFGFISLYILTLSNICHAKFVNGHLQTLEVCENLLTIFLKSYKNFMGTNSNDSSIFHELNI